MRVVTQRVKRFVEHPITRFVVGLLLLGTATAEIYTGFQLGNDTSLGSHHGIFIFGLFNALAALPDLLDGIASSAEYVEHIDT